MSWRSRVQGKRIAVIIIACIMVVGPAVGASAVTDKPVYTSDGFYYGFESTADGDVPDTFTKTGGSGVTAAATDDNPNSNNINGAESGSFYMYMDSSADPTRIVSNNTFGLKDGNSQFEGSLYYHWEDTVSTADSRVELLNLTDSAGNELVFRHCADDVGCDGYKITGDIVQDTGSWQGNGFDVADRTGAGWTRMEMSVNSTHANLTVYDGSNPFILTEPLAGSFSNPSDVTVSFAHQDGKSGSMVARWDNITINDVGFTGPAITGELTDSNGNPITGPDANVTISGPTSEEVTTNSIGVYRTSSVPSGTYTVETAVPGYINKSATVTVNSQDVTQDFTLLTTNETLDLRTKKYLQHGERTTFEVINTNATTGHRSDVTSQAAVSGNNTSLLTVSGNELVATNNQSREGLVAVTATYQNKSDVVVVFVGNITIDNFALLPPWARFDALIASNVEGSPNNMTTFLLLGAALAGAVFRFVGDDSAYTGLAAFQLIIIAGWIIGRTGTGVLLLSLAATGFVALNLATNVDALPG